MTEQQWLEDDGQFLMQVGPFAAPDRKLRLTALGIARLLPEPFDGPPPLDLIDAVEDAADGEVSAGHWLGVRGHLHAQFGLRGATAWRTVDWAMRDVVNRWTLADGPIHFYLGCNEGSCEWWEVNSRVASINHPRNLRQSVPPRGV
ncbi:MAG: hypothetical protein U0792_03220 [Gemmataceae bacterium]